MLSHDGADREQHDEMWTMRKTTSLTSLVVFDLVSLAAIVLPVTCTSLGLRLRWLLKRIVPMTAEESTVRTLPRRDEDGKR